MGQLSRTFSIIFPNGEEQRVKKVIRNFKNRVDINYKGNSYSFYCEDNSYILKSKKRVSRREIEELSKIISSELGFKPICFCDVYTEENGIIAVNPTIEWSMNQPPHVIESNIRSAAGKSGKVIVYPDNEFLIKTWGLNTFNPIIFGYPPFIDFEERIKTCVESDLYLMIDVLARYNLCVNDKTWKDRKYNKADINKYYEMAILATNRFIGEISYPINRSNPSEIVHTKEYTNWFYDWKEYFDNNEVINSYIGLKKKNSDYHIKRLPYSVNRG